MSATVAVEMFEDEFAVRWLSRNALGALHWNDIDELITFYRENGGSKAIMFDADSCRYSLQDKPKAEAA